MSVRVFDGETSYGVQVLAQPFFNHPLLKRRCERQRWPMTLLCQRPPPLVLTPDSSILHAPKSKTTRSTFQRPPRPCMLRARGTFLTPALPCLEIMAHYPSLCGKWPTVKRQMYEFTTYICRECRPFDFPLSHFLARRFCSASCRPDHRWGKRPVHVPRGRHGHHHHIRDAVRCEDGLFCWG